MRQIAEQKASLALWFGLLGAKEYITRSLKHQELRHQERLETPGAVMLLSLSKSMQSDSKSPSICPIPLSPSCSEI